MQSWKKLHYKKGKHNRKRRWYRMVRRRAVKPTKETPDFASANRSRDEISQQTKECHNTIKDAWKRRKRVCLQKTKDQIPEK
jgi:hypothetical protein